MATVLENLELSIAQQLERIVEVTASVQPDYSINGQSVSKAAYLATLWDTLNKAVALRAALGGPYEVVTYKR